MNEEAQYWKDYAEAGDKKLAEERAELARVTVALEGSRELVLAHIAIGDRLHDELARAKAEAEASHSACLVAEEAAQKAEAERDEAREQRNTSLNSNAKLREERDQHAAELAALRRDKARLDWLENPDACYWAEIQRQPDALPIWNSHGIGLRAAIDAAMKGGKS